jgi:hypothetical protein
MFIDFNIMKFIPKHFIIGASIRGSPGGYITISSSIMPNEYGSPSAIFLA